MVLGHLFHQKCNCEITLNCVVFWLPYSFKIWITILKERDFLEVIAFNRSIILKQSVKKRGLQYVDCICLALNCDQ
jgi:hypothetical protein